MRTPTLMAALACGAASAIAWAVLTGTGREARADERTDGGLAAFETVRAVLQHPRCAACHIEGDAPLQRDELRVHGQNVKRGPKGEGAPGLECHTCHGESNPPDSYGPHLPPGGPDWKLPPPEMPMVFHGVSATQLARTLQDPAKNGGRTLASMLDHVEHAPLVLWGWSPGFGRGPVPIPHAQFTAAFRAWVDAGAPVPPER